ncbi:MAG: TRAP transporter small permease [Firmicutes bacterium]|jgi:TRAP-type C4-dicarboxylate transport system permease small subunit|nr:TRAP transporter small permease [Bacillota bacterium]
MGKKLQAIEKALGGLLVFAVFVVVIIQVFYRYVLDHPIFWSDELASYLFIWMVAIGTAYAQSSRSHVRMDIVSSRLPARLAWITGLALNVIILVCLISSLGPGLKLANLMMKFKTPGLRVSWAVVLISSPVCFTLVCLHIIEDTVTALRSRFGHRRQDSPRNAGRAS